MKDQSEIDPISLMSFVFSLDVRTDSNKLPVRAILHKKPDDIDLSDGFYTLAFNLSPKDNKDFSPKLREEFSNLFCKIIKESKHLPDFEEFRFTADKEVDEEKSEAFVLFFPFR